MTTALAILAWIATAVLLQWREHRILKRARLEGYAAGWAACEAHAKAHQAVCPDPDPEEAFAEGFELAMRLSKDDEPIDVEVECGCPRCRAQAYSVN